MEVINYLLGYENLYIVQDTEMFHFSLDSLLLPHFVTLKKNISNVLDIGTGNAPIPLILSTKTKAHITGVELQEQVFHLAKKSIAINHLEDQICLIHGDINQVSKQMLTDTFDVITCNPPFFRLNSGSHLNFSNYKTIARHEVTLTLEQIMQISRKLLKNNGVIGLVHRPERLLDIFEAMRKNNIEPKKLQLIYPKLGKNANIILVEGSKNGNPGLKILPPLYVHKENGEYTEEIKQYIKMG